MSYIFTVADITATTSITESPPVTAGPSFSQLGDINDTGLLHNVLDNHLQPVLKI